MIGISGIADNKFCWNSLTSQHRSHYCRIIKTDSFFLLINLIQIWHITRLYRLGKFFVIFIIFNDIVVYLFNLCQIVFTIFCNRGCFLHNFRAFRVIYKLVRTQIRPKLVGHFDIYFQCHLHRITTTHFIKQINRIGSISFRQWNNLILIHGKCIFVTIIQRLSPGRNNTFQRRTQCLLKFHHHVTVCRVGIVNHTIITFLNLFPTRNSRIDNCFCPAFAV